MFAIGRAARAISNEFGPGPYSNHSGYEFGYTGCCGRCRQQRHRRGSSGYAYATPCVHRGPPHGQSVVGQLLVTIVSITAPSEGILSLSHNRFEDPFIIVQLAGDYSRTRTLHGPIFGSLDWPNGEEMFFRDTLGFPIWAAHGTEEIKFFVYGKKKHREEKYLASASISIGRSLTMGQDEVVLQMLGQNGMPYGQIHIRLRYERRGASADSPHGSDALNSRGIPIPQSGSEQGGLGGSPPGAQSFGSFGGSYGTTIVVYNASEDAFIAVPEKREGEEGSLLGGGSLSPASSRSSSFSLSFSRRA